MDLGPQGEKRFFFSISSLVGDRADIQTLTVSQERESERERENMTQYCSVFNY